MCKKTALLPFIAVFLITAPCNAMQMAAQYKQQSNQSIETSNETAARELIERLLNNKYGDMASKLNELSDAHKELLKNVLNKKYLFTPQAH